MIKKNKAVKTPIYKQVLQFLKYYDIFGEKVELRFNG